MADVPLPCRLLADQWVIGTAAPAVTAVQCCDSYGVKSWYD